MPACYSEMNANPEDDLAQKKFQQCNNIKNLMKKCVVELSFIQFKNIEHCFVSC